MDLNPLGKRYSPLTFVFLSTLKLGILMKICFKIERIYYFLVFFENIYIFFRFYLSSQFNRLLYIS